MILYLTGLQEPLEYRQYWCLFQFLPHCKHSGILWYSEIQEFKINRPFKKIIPTYFHPSGAYGWGIGLKTEPESKSSSFFSCIITCWHSLLSQFFVLICSVCWVLLSQCLTSCASQHGSQSGDDCFEQQHKGKLWKDSSFKSYPWDIDGHRLRQVARDHIFTQVSTGKHFSKLFCINGHQVYDAQTH